MAASFVAALMILQGSSFTPPTRAELLGNSPDQVIRMGREKWGDFYGNKNGWSTAAMVDAETLWGRSRRVINDRALKTRTKGQRQAAADLRREMDLYWQDACTVGYIISGGGTIWHPVFASSMTETEEVISRILRNIRPGKPSMGVVEAEGRLRKILEANKKDIGEMNSAAGTYQDALKKLNGLRVRLSRLEALGPKLAPASSGYFQVFAVKTLRMAADMTGAEESRN